MKKSRLWKKTAVIMMAALLIGMMDRFWEPAAVLAAPTTQEKIDQTQEQLDQLENALDQTQGNLNQLENEGTSLKKQLDNLNSQLMAVAEKLTDLERQIADKEQELAETLAALKDARATEERQYDSMKVMLRCMYEMREDTYLSALLTSLSFSDLLNRADNIERTVAYSRQKMEEYQENRRLIEEWEAKLQAEHAELDSLIEQANAEQGRLNELIAETSKSINKNADAIAEAERQARAYEAEIKKQEEDLAALKKKLAEERAMSQAAANGVWRDISEITFEENDRYLLANLIYCEAGGEPYEGQVAVGAVVMNRVLSSKFPGTVAGVIYQGGQFAPVASGRLALALSLNMATDKCYRAADEAMSGVTNVGQCLFFRTHIPGLTGIYIGGHTFY